MLAYVSANISISLKIRLVSFLQLSIRSLYIVGLIRERCNKFNTETIGLSGNEKGDKQRPRRGEDWPPCHTRHRNKDPVKKLKEINRWDGKWCTFLRKIQQYRTYCTPTGNNGRDWLSQRRWEITADDLPLPRILRFFWEHNKPFVRHRRTV